MKKTKTEVAILLESFKKHKEIKKQLLNLIQNNYSENLYVKDDLYSQSISKLDWSMSSNFEREWVKLFKPYLQEHFNKCANILGYRTCHIKNLWFQQYTKNDTHAWHIHSDHYTGVYYLEFPKKSTKTEIVDHFNKKTKINAKEGDIVIFPSFLVHRSPIIKHNVIKTIISFNIEFEGIYKGYMEKISK
jgi:hypothetical protein